MRQQQDCNRIQSSLAVETALACVDLHALVLTHATTALEQLQTSGLLGYHRSLNECRPMQTPPVGGVGSDSQPGMSQVTPLALACCWGFNLIVAMLLSLPQTDVNLGDEVR